MKNIPFKLLLVLSLVSYFGCEKVTWLPIQGDIEGFVTDNNGQTLAGVTVTASFESPTEFGQAEMKSSTFVTGPDGYYRLEDLWDAVQIRAEHPGHELTSVLVELKLKDQSPRVDFSLNGSPFIQGLTFSKTNLSVTSGILDSIQFTLEVTDAYNNMLGDYQSNLLLENGSGSTQAIIPGTIQSQGLDRVLLQGWITSEDLVSGTYRVSAETLDPDNNSYFLTTDISILAE